MDITECAAPICTNSDRVVWDAGHICARGEAGMTEAGPTNALAAF